MNQFVLGLIIGVLGGGFAVGVYLRAKIKALEAKLAGPKPMPEPLPHPPRPGPTPP